MGYRRRSRRRHEPGWTRRHRPMELSWRTLNVDAKGAVKTTCSSRLVAGRGALSAGWCRHRTAGTGGDAPEACTGLWRAGAGPTCAIGA